MITARTRAQRVATGIGALAGATIAAGLLGGPAAAAAPAPAAPAPAAPATAVQRCTAGQLTGQVAGDRSIGSHGSLGRDLTFMQLVNTSATTCFVQGYPRVRVYDSTGMLAGPPAQRRVRATPAKVVLAPQAVAGFEIHDVYTAQARCQGDLDGSVRITLPHTAALTVPYYGYSACNLSVTAVHRGRRA